MILDVPLTRQPKDSVDCGIAGLAMLLKYYRLNKSFKDLKKEIEVDEVGTYAPQLGSYLIKHGFDVEIVTLHPMLFTNKDKEFSKKEVLSRFKELYKTAKIDRNKKILNYFIKFIKDGGKINIKIPSLEDIKEELSSNRPICALLTSNFILGSTPKFNFHFNVITGFDNDYIYVNDPLWDDERGGKKKYKIRDFFFGLYVSCYGDLDNACLIKIKKK